jgi:hypothetical protein
VAPLPKGYEGQFGPGLKALALALPGCLHPLAKGSPRFAHPVVRELLVLHPGHLDVDVDVVQEGPGDVPDPFRVRLVAADYGVGAGASLDRIPIPSAGAGIVAKQPFSLVLR